MLGLVVVGDLAGQTIYTDRHGRKIFYKQSPPQKPPSAMQTLQRQRFADAVQNWHDATAETRDNYEKASLAASLSMTGLNLWVSISLTAKLAVLATIQRQTLVELPPPPNVPWPA